MNTNKVFTIGHSTHTMNYFIKLLKQHNVLLVCDVRSQPYSKYNSQFNKNIVQKTLLESGIEYAFLGEELGGRSKNTALYNDKGQLQYNLLAQDLFFKKGLEMLITKVKKYNIALMCSEADPLKCHRTILVCRQLYKNLHLSKNNIQHILSDGTLQTNIELEKTLMDNLNIAPDMLRNEEECINEAYKRQAQKIAYSYKGDSSLIEDTQPSKQDLGHIL